jgi:hypothetical protein
VTPRADEFRSAPLPKRYALSVEVKLIEIPGQFNEPPEPIRESDDPMKMAAQLFNRVANPPAIPAIMYEQPAGLNFRKACTVTVSEFMGLSRILCDFDELVKQIEEHHL